MNLLELIDCLDEDLIDWYMWNYETDDLDELISYLHKCGFNKEKVIFIFNNDNLFYRCWECFLSSQE